MSSNTAVAAPYDVTAVIHASSPAPATVHDLIESAADAEADVLVLTRPDAEETGDGALGGWHHGVLLIAGLELAARPGHVVALGSDADGIELWTVGAAAPAEHPPGWVLADWDRLCSRRRVVALGGLDGTHDAGFFRVLRTHVLCERPPTGDAESDRLLVLGALRQGRCYIGRDALARSRGFRYYADGPGGFVPMGGEAQAGPWTLHSRLPFRAELRLVRDGRELHSAFAASLDVEVHQPGVYRVEAELRALGKRRTWILSNPVYLRG